MPGRRRSSCPCWRKSGPTRSASGLWMRPRCGTRPPCSGVTWTSGLGRSGPSSRRSVRPSTPAPIRWSGPSWSGRFHEVETRYKAALAEGLDALLPEAFATVREACRRLLGTTGRGDRSRTHLGHGALRCAADRWLDAAPGPDRGNGDRRGQDAGGHAAALPQRALGTRGAPGHGQQLPRPPRLPVDGAPVPLPGPHGGLPRRHRAVEPRASRRLPGRHHLRHQQRVRLRLPARQHGVHPRAAGAAPARVRHHRRGRLDPDRRGADAADHLRAGRARWR